VLEQELKQGGYEPNLLLIKPMQAAFKVVVAEIARFSSVRKASLFP